jgi:GntR family transcriptional regulator, galactonate operon transcriptional repressor
MKASFAAIDAPERLHTRITRTLALRVLDSDEANEVVVFPKEADLSQQLGVSRTVLRESMKVLVDKGMIEMKPRAGTRSRPRACWRQLDPDILTWQAETHPSPEFLRNLSEVRLAIEPTAAGFAAVRATAGELECLAQCLRRRGQAGTSVEEVTELDLEFHTAIVAAGHNPLLVELSAVIRGPIRTALAAASRFSSTLELGLEAHRTLLDCLQRRDPLAARRAAEAVVGLGMLAIEKAIQSQERRTRPAKRPGGEL